MSKIVYKLFGAPQITVDGRSVFFPYAKINALLYYLAVNKMASRDELGGLLWPDEDGAVARKNIRNAIYQAKKSLGEDIIISPQKSVLLMNEALDIESDTDLFSRAPQENLECYQGDFLQGFFLKEADAFEFWVTKVRSGFQEKFATECCLKIERSLQERNYDGVENLIRRLIELDEFDERNFRLLMRLYQDTGRSGKAVETYYDLSKLLHRELGIDPDKKTKEIYERALEQIDFGGEKRRARDTASIYGRYQELAAMEKTLKEFRQKRGGTTLLITGETGIGKSTLKRRLLEKAASDFLILEVSCYQVEKDWPLRIWSAVVRTISRLIQRNRLIPPNLWKELMSGVFPDFSENLPGSGYVRTPERWSMASMVQILREGLEKISAEKQVILAIEDIQWMDDESLALLTALLLETDPLRVMLVATCGRERNQALEDALTALRRSGRLTTVSLERLDIEQCHCFIEEALPKKELKGETLEQVYNETEGNPFFLNECVGLLQKGHELGTMTPTALEAVRSRLLYLQPDERTLVELLSFFYDATPLRFLARLMEREDERMLTLLETLEDRDILREKEQEGETAVLFSHVKLREYVYLSQPSSRKKLIHRKIGQLLEERVNVKKRDTRLNAKLVYHFSAAGDRLKALQYQMDTLKSCLNFNHEMFPILNNLEMGQEPNVYMSRDQIGELFGNLETGLKEALNFPGDSDELNLLETEFYYLKGRYLIREGEYAGGVDSITHVIEKARQIGNLDYELEGCKQLIIYHLQVYNLEEMAEYIKLSLDLAVRCNYHKEIGIILRLKGLYNLMVGNYYLAEKLLTESISTLTITETVAKRYATNVAAAYCYIGEIRQAEEDYPEALALFQKAISLCTGQNVSSSLSYFYINAGKTAYFMESFSAAKSYFEQAYALYGQFDSFWRRPVLDAYMALVLMQEGQYENAKWCLSSAQNSAGKIKDPSELGTVLFAEALIRQMADRDEEIGAVFAQDLKESAGQYYALALKNLSKYCNRYERKTLLRQFASEGEPEQDA
ncbi:AAA family ATPase [Oscillibacter ruminantium]|nr:AAA family ATPase [Oscillibacter valericigenes]